MNFNPRNYRFGIFLPKQRDPLNPEESKKLTFDTHGNTNNTCIKLDGYENLFGQPPGDWLRDPKTEKYVKGVEDPKGRWTSAKHLGNADRDAHSE